jgi:hypothetical protein
LIEQAKKRYLQHEGSKEELIYQLSKADDNDRLINITQNYDERRQSGASSHLIQGEFDRESCSKDGIDYDTKDNSKLITLLQDRGLDVPETRIDKIKVLEKNPSDYYSYSKTKLEQILLTRNVRCFKATKINLVETLKHNDAVDRDTGNLKEAAMYGKFLNMWEVVKEIGDKRENLNWSNPYEASSDEDLRKFVSAKELDNTGRQSSLPKRLWEFDKETLEKEIDQYKSNYERMMARFKIQVRRDLCCLQSYTNELNLGRQVEGGTLIVL